MKKLFFFFIIIIVLFSLNHLKSKEVKIIAKIGGQILTNIDIENEYKYLVSLNNDYQKLEKNKIYNFAKSSLLREKIKEIELKKYFELGVQDSFLNDKITDEYDKKADYFDPEGYGNTYWNEQEEGRESEMFDFGDDDDDFDFDDDFGDAKTDDFGQPLSKLGSKQQKSALELKVKVPVGSLKKVKLNSNHRVTNQDGNPTKLSVFQDEKSKKYYGIDDEGNIYENDTEDFRDIKEPTTDAKGFPGAVTSRGQSLIDKRAGKQKEDEYDKTSFADLLDLLGIDTDIDYTNPFAGN